MTLLLGVVVFASAHPSPWQWSMPQWNYSPEELPTLPVATAPAGSALPETAPAHSNFWIWVLIVVGILLVGALVFFLVRLIIQAINALVAARIEAKPQADSLEGADSVRATALSPAQIHDAVAEALARLDQAATARDGVILAWLSFEEAANRHGVGRLPSQTPSEFTAVVLDLSAVPPSAATGLRSLYLRARFSAAPTTAADVLHARTCLETIATSLDNRQTDDTPDESAEPAS